MHRIYLDANATTPLLPEVFEAMRPYWMEHYGNASSIHQHGQQARGAVEQSRAAIARLLRCLNSEIVFTSGGTESDNLALFGVLSPESTHGEPAHLITTTIEHHAVLHAAEALEKTGVEVTFLPSTPEGLIEPAALKTALRPHTKLVSIMYANNETGVIQPIQELAAIAHEAGALFHTDAVQVTGKLPLDLSVEGPLKNVDLLTFSGHKMYAPKGIGVLFVRKNVRLAPMMHGGTHERQRRAGTENVACIVGLGKAAQLASEWLNTEGHTQLTALRDRFEQGILSQIEETGINGTRPPSLQHQQPLLRPPRGRSPRHRPRPQGLSVSGGSACQSGAAEPSHVLTAMGLTPPEPEPASASPSPASPHKKKSTKP